jgi:hypothetical protein
LFLPDDWHMSERIDFEDWLGSELRRRLDPRLSSVPAPRYRNENVGRGPMPKLITGLVAALATKTAAGLTVAALAAGTTGAVVVGVESGAIEHFSESMKSTVADCKSQPPTNGQHGIGACVALSARHHGSDARLNNPGQGHKPDQTGKSGETGKPDGTGKPNETGKPASPGHSGEHGKPTPKPTDGSGAENGAGD